MSAKIKTRSKFVVIRGGVPFKTCARCGALKLPAMYYPEPRRPLGVSRICKECTREQLAPHKEAADANRAEARRHCKELNRLKRITAPEPLNLLPGEVHPNLKAEAMREARAQFKTRTWESPKARRHEGLKNCSACGRTKSTLDYHRNYKSTDGLTRYCKACTALHNSASRHRKALKDARVVPVPELSLIMSLIRRAPVVPSQKATEAAQTRLGWINRHTVNFPDQEKRCSKCGIVHNLDMFNKKSTTRDGLHSWCKYCVRESAAGISHRRHTYGTRRPCVEILSPRVRLAFMGAFDAFAAPFSPLRKYLGGSDIDNMEK
jgi:hypothetical protein